MENVQLINDRARENSNNYTELLEEDFFLRENILTFHFALINNISGITFARARVFPAIVTSMRETREMISAVIARSWDAPDALIFLKE